MPTSEWVWKAANMPSGALATFGGGAAKAGAARHKHAIRLRSVFMSPSTDGCYPNAVLRRPIYRGFWLNDLRISKIFEVIRLPAQRAQERLLLRHPDQALRLARWCHH